jgi:hypothetical protein
MALVDVSFPTSPLGRPILRTKHTIRSPSLRQIRDQYDGFFNASNCDGIDINICHNEKKTNVRFEGGIRSWMNPTSRFFTWS